MYEESFYCELMQHCFSLFVPQKKQKTEELPLFFFLFSSCCITT